MVKIAPIIINKIANGSLIISECGLILYFIIKFLRFIESPFQGFL